MTIKDLKNKLKDFPDDMEFLLSVTIDWEKEMIQNSYTTEASKPEYQFDWWIEDSGDGIVNLGILMNGYNIEKHVADVRKAW
jgi:hypothetical protein